MQTVTGLAKSIESQYHKENSYHSGVHGADVLQTVHVLLTQGRAGQRMEPVQRLSMLLAAAAHDVGTYAWKRVGGGSVCVCCVRVWHRPP